MAAKKTVEIVEEFRFTKEQLISSKRYVDKTDVLNVVLNDDKEYSLKEVDGLIKTFYERLGD
jgi:hypothetical protein